MKNMYVYITTNKKYGVLYTGVTNNLLRRIYGHKNKITEGFTSRYNVHFLVYYEFFDNELAAITGEKQIKSYKRQKKIDLIKDFNPEWKDLYSTLI